MKTKKTDPNQLWLDFENALETHRESTEALMKASRALHESPEVTPDTKKKAKKDITEERKLFTKLVRVSAYRNYDGCFAKSYARVYQELKMRTGFDVYAWLDKCSTPRATILEAHGYMGEALKIARAVL